MDLKISIGAGIPTDAQKSDSAIARVDIAAVDEQAAAVIRKIAELSRQQEYATGLRLQRDSVLTREEKACVDETLDVVEEIGRRIGRLVDRCAGESKIRQKADVCDSLILWDSHELPELLHEIDQATRWLSTATIILLREAAVGDDTSVTAWVNPGRPPPSYEESTFLMERREKNLRRKSSLDPSLSKDTGSLHRPESVMESISELEGEKPHKEATDATSESNGEQKSQLVKELTTAIQRRSALPASYRAYKPGLSSSKSTFTSPSLPPEAPDFDQPSRARDNLPVAASIPKRWTQLADADLFLPQSLRIQVPARKSVPPPVPPKPKLFRTSASEHPLPTEGLLDPVVERKRCPSLPQALVRQTSVWSLEHKFPQYLEDLAAPSENTAVPRSSLSRYRGRTTKRSSVQSLPQPIDATKEYASIKQPFKPRDPVDTTESVESKEPVDSKHRAVIQGSAENHQPPRPSRRDTSQAPEVAPSERPESAPEVFLSTLNQQAESSRRLSEVASDAFKPPPDRPAPRRPDSSDSAPELFIPATTRPAVARRIQRREALLARTASPVVYVPGHVSRESSATGLAQYTSVRPMSTPLMPSRSSTELRPDYNPLGQ